MSCDCADDDGGRLVDHTFPVATRCYTCDECDAEIAPGERYERYTHVGGDYDGFCITQLCASCSVWIYEFDVWAQKQKGCWCWCIRDGAETLSEVHHDLHGTQPTARVA